MHSPLYLSVNALGLEYNIARIQLFRTFPSVTRTGSSKVIQPIKFNLDHTAGLTGLTVMQQPTGQWYQFFLFFLMWNIFSEAFKWKMPPKSVTVPLKKSQTIKNVFKKRYGICGKK